MSVDSTLVERVVELVTVCEPVIVAAVRCPQLVHRVSENLPSHQRLAGLVFLRDLYRALGSTLAAPPPAASAGAAVAGAAAAVVSPRSAAAVVTSPSSAGADSAAAVAPATLALPQQQGGAVGPSVSSSGGTGCVNVASSAGSSAASCSAGAVDEDLVDFSNASKLFLQFRTALCGQVNAPCAPEMDESFGTARIKTLGLVHGDSEPLRQLLKASPPLLKFLSTSLGLIETKELSDKERQQIFAQDWGVDNCFADEENFSLDPEEVVISTAQSHKRRAMLRDVAGAISARNPRAASTLEVPPKGSVAGSSSSPLSTTTSSSSSSSAASSGAGLAAAQKGGAAAPSSPVTVAPSPINNSVGRPGSISSPRSVSPLPGDAAGTPPNLLPTTRVEDSPVAASLDPSAAAGATTTASSTNRQHSDPFLASPTAGAAAAATPRPAAQQQQQQVDRKLVNKSVDAIHRFFCQYPHFAAFKQLRVTAREALFSLNALWCLSHPCVAEEIDYFVVAEADAAPTASTAAATSSSTGVDEESSMTTARQRRSNDSSAGALLEDEPFHLWQNQNAHDAHFRSKDAETMRASSLYASDGGSSSSSNYPAHLRAVIKDPQVLEVASKLSSERPLEERVRFLLELNLAIQTKVPEDVWRSMLRVMDKVNLHLRKCRPTFQGAALAAAQAKSLKDKLAATSLEAVDRSLARTTISTPSLKPHELGVRIADYLMVVLHEFAQVADRHNVHEIMSDTGDPSKDSEMVLTLRQLVAVIKWAVREVQRLTETAKQATKK